MLTGEKLNVTTKFERGFLRKRKLKKHLITLSDENLYACETVSKYILCNYITIEKYAIKYFNKKYLNGLLWIITAKLNLSTFVVYS